MTVRRRWGVCPSGKIWHRNRRDCYRAIEQLRHTRRRAVPDLWPYQCTECGGWHLTSKPQKADRAGRGDTAPTDHAPNGPQSSDPS